MGVVVTTCHRNEMAAVVPPIVWNIHECTLTLLWISDPSNVLITVSCQLNLVAIGCRFESHFGSLKISITTPKAMLV